MVRAATKIGISAEMKMTWASATFSIKNIYPIKMKKLSASCWSPMQKYPTILKDIAIIARKGIDTRKLDNRYDSIE